MRVDLSEQLLFQHICKIETSQSIVLIYECVEFYEVDLVCLPGGIVEGLFEAIVCL